MNGNLGREKLWNPQIWSDIDKAVQEEVGRIRVAQKVFPSTLLPSGQPIPTDTRSNRIPGVLMISEGLSRPFVSTEVEFALTQSQVDNEESQHTGRTLARMAANVIAAAEDVLLFQGNPQKEKGKAHEGFFEALREKNFLVTIENAESLKNGFLGQHENTDKDPYLVVNDVKSDPDDIVDKVGQGIAKLRKRSHVGPYALFLSSEKFADASAPTPKFYFATAADRINSLVVGGFYGTGSLLKSDGLLVSVGGEPTTIYIGNDTTVEFTQIDNNGRYRFRVFERFQFVARDPGAFVRLKLLDESAKKD
jgi:uncharacterized linocin/CFP29 family protein